MNESFSLATDDRTAFTCNMEYANEWYDLTKCLVYVSGQYLYTANNNRYNKL